MGNWLFVLYNFSYICRILPNTTNLVMKVLAICVGNAGAIFSIYERIIDGLAEYADVDVLTSNLDIKLSERVGKVYKVPYSRLMRKIYRRTLLYFEAVPTCEHWAKCALKQIDRDYDIVFAITSSVPLTPIVAGRCIAQKLGSKFAIYSVDAIPGPGGWTKPRRYRSELKIVKRCFSAADYVSSSNGHMLKFQLTTFAPKPGLITNVHYTPSSSRSYECPASTEDVLLYTGAIYGLRNPEYMLDAFRRLLTVRPNAQLVLLGTRLKHCYERYLHKTYNQEEIGHVHILPSTSDLEPYYRRAKVLIDMDGDREEDPFMSSKVIVYLNVNRVILTETGSNTPSRELFADMQTVVQVSHNADSVFEGMTRALELAEQDLDYSERQPLIEKFSSQHVCLSLWGDFQRLCSIKEEDIS